MKEERTRKRERDRESVASKTRNSRSTDLAPPASIPVARLADVVVRPFSFVPETGIDRDLLERGGDGEGVGDDVVDGYQRVGQGQSQLFRGEIGAYDRVKLTGRDDVVVQDDLAALPVDPIVHLFTLPSRRTPSVLGIIAPEDHLGVSSLGGHLEHLIVVLSVGRTEVLGFETEDLGHGFFDAVEFVVPTGSDSGCSGQLERRDEV